MLEQTKKLLEETQEIMDLCMGQILNTDMLQHMSGEEFEMYKKTYALMEHSKELVLEQARLMDELELKLNRVLTLLESH